MLQGCLAKVLLFKQLDPSMQRKVVSETYERTVQAGEILITEGDTGLAASELYIVKSGEFEVQSDLVTSWQGQSRFLRQCESLCSRWAFLHPSDMADIAAGPWFHVRISCVLSSASCCRCAGVHASSLICAALCICLRHPYIHHLLSVHRLALLMIL